MTEPRAGLKRGYYLLNTDGGSASTWGRRSGDPLPVAAIGALLRTSRLATVAQISEAIGPATHNMAEYRALIEGLKLARDRPFFRQQTDMPRSPRGVASSVGPPECHPRREPRGVPREVPDESRCTTQARVRT
jgi:hypothetical protein